jgi:hypothetical protein
MRAAAWGAIALAWFALLFVACWSFMAFYDAKERCRTGERYVPYRDLGGRPTLSNRLFDWFNETADRVVRP